MPQSPPSQAESLQAWLRWHQPPQEPSADTNRRGKQGGSHTMHLPHSSTKTMAEVVSSSWDVQLAQAEQTPF